MFEIRDGGIFYTKEEYVVYLNGERYGKASETFLSLYGLKPDTSYCLEVVGETERACEYFSTNYEAYTLDVRDFGAKGDGVSDDTTFIQAAIMACPKDSRVLIPAGTYKVTSIFLKSNLKLELGKGAVLSAFTEREKRPIMPGMIESYDENSELNLGTWEGNPLPMFGAVIHGMNVENVVIYGEGCLDGCASWENWWEQVRVMRGAWRPRMIFLNHCRNITIQGITVTNSPSWNIHPYFSTDLKFIAMKVLGPKVSPNTDALDPESCKNVDILGMYFSVGDDCIAVKSGKIYMGSKYKVPSENITIRQCLMRDGHGSITLGSEMAGGIQKLSVKECLFVNTDRGLRIKTRRGRGEDAVINKITFENIKMDGVMTPLVINSFYFCDPDGHTSYVRDKNPHPVDERTPYIKDLVFRNMECKNCHVAAAFFYGLPEQKIRSVTMENIAFSFAKDCRADVPAMMEGIEPVTRMGVYANNIKHLKMSHVTVEGQEGEAFIIENVDELEQF